VNCHQTQAPIADLDRLEESISAMTLLWLWDSKVATIIAFDHFNGIGIR
jgi:hypothetical protein